MEKRKKGEWEKRERGWPKGPTGRFPPKGRKNRLKYSTGSVGGRASNEEEILKKNLLRVSQLGGRKTRSHSREGQFKSSLSPGFLFFSCERATLRQEQCDADQTVEPCNCFPIKRRDREEQASLLRLFVQLCVDARSQKMRGSWIEKHWIYFFFWNPNFFSFSPF